MVNGFGRGQSTYITPKKELGTIRYIFEQIDVPERWYSFDTPRENTLCFTQEEDGIHTFICERGQKTGEQVFQSWYDAIRDAAQSFEPRYTDAVMHASELVHMEEMMSQEVKDAIRAVKGRQRMKRRSMPRRRNTAAREKARA